MHGSLRKPPAFRPDIFILSLRPTAKLLQLIDFPLPTLRSARTISGEIKMDWLFLSLIAAFFGVSVLLVAGCELLRRPS
jgi:hypothetical protein